MPIQISVDPVNGNITVAPTVANYNKGDLVQWEAKGGTSLTLSFKADGSPFDVPTIQGTAGAGTATAERTILTTAASGQYHYSLAATINGTPYTIPGCPEIVVQ